MLHFLTERQFRQTHYQILENGNFIMPTVLPIGKRKKHHDESLIKWLTDELKKRVYNNPTFTLNGIATTSKKEKVLNIGILFKYINLRCAFF
jgi:hypothetical protein